jgi:methylthioribulose-1-phosphate dehydratase
MADNMTGMISEAARDAIIRAGRRMDERGWVPATAGNISMRLDEATIAITRSGGHKGFLTPDSVIAVDLDGNALTPGAKPSAETLLHCQIYRKFPGVRAVLHGHSVAGTVLSMEEKATTIAFQGYEVQKIFAGQTTHETALMLPVVANDQDMARLAGMVAARLDQAQMGYLIRGHGVYVWAEDMDMALARLEGLEFLLACAWERRRR